MTQNWWYETCLYIILVEYGYCRRTTILKIPDDVLRNDLGRCSLGFELIEEPAEAGRGRLFTVRCSGASKTTFSMKKDFLMTELLRETITSCINHSKEAVYFHC